MRKISITVLAVFLLMFMFMPIIQAQTPQETLNQYISDLQKNPNDSVLREKIIKHVQGMKPAPKVPKEVATNEGAAEYVFKNAKTDGDFEDAAKEYEKALLVAPWLAADYFSCGVAYEKARKYDAAIQNFNLYLIAVPDAQDEYEVHKRIGSLKYAANKAAKETSAANGSQPFVPVAKEKARDGRFIAYDNGTVLDTKTNLMWAAKDNGSDINWQGAKSYCENYRGGGYTDWRMPTLDELAGLLDQSKSRPTSSCRTLFSSYTIHVATELIDITCFVVLASETNGSEVGNFRFNNGNAPRKWWRKQSHYDYSRALPVRFAKANASTDSNLSRQTTTATQPIKSNAPEELQTFTGEVKIIEVRHFTQSEGLGLSQEFINSFYDGLRERLAKNNVAGQIVDEGSAVPDAVAANTLMVEGKFTEYKKGGFLEGVGMVGSEIKFYRKSDHALIKIITPRVPFKPSPLNSDSGLGRSTGYRIADEIKKALK